VVEPADAGAPRTTVGGPGTVTVLTVSKAVAAPEERVFSLVSDLARMGEWSPEATGGRWLEPATGPAAGARFRGTNGSGLRRWSSVATVTDYDPPRRFAFGVVAVGLSVSEWAYTIEPSPSGCTVTETWTDRRGRTITWLGTLVSGVFDRVAFNRAGMEATLAHLAAAAERAGSG
jgi:Polyketide cyclase / dehydrase and lipid transport